MKPCTPPELAEIARLEHLAFAAWPAEEVVAVEGWRLRAMRGVTRRANSVFTCGKVLDPGAATLSAEAEYRRRGLPALFTISPATEPSCLDGFLAARGYVVESPVSIQTAELASVLDSSLDAKGATGSVGLQASPDWVDLAVSRGRFASVRPLFCGLVSRLGERAAFALARLDGRPVASALCVAQAEWVGVFSMAVLAEARRQGAASALLQAIAGYGLARGATKAYLQVERQNDAALRIYARAGFREVYGYHYRLERNI